ncbi:MAG: RDD family protein [Myxococcales bacterium]
MLPRLLARLTDFLLAMVLPVAAGTLGAILAPLFVLFGDGIFHGQSFGKKLMGIKVVHLPTRSDIDYRESALRNFPFALAWLVAPLPQVGNVLFWLVTAAAVVWEGWQVVGDSLGLRMGDVVAETQVVDTKVPVGKAEGRPVLKVVGSEPRTFLNRSRF